MSRGEGVDGPQGRARWEPSLRVSGRSARLLRRLRVPAVPTRDDAERQSRVPGSCMTITAAGPKTLFNPKPFLTKHPEILVKCPGL